MGTGTSGLTNCLTFKARTEDYYYSSSATSSASETYTAVRTVKT